MLRLRPYRTNDAAVILQWAKDKQSFYQWTAGVLGDYPLKEEQFQKAGNLMAFTAEDDGALVGFFTMRRPSESFDELRFGFVIIDPQKRRKGYGKAMLKLGLKYAKDIYGAKEVSLGVFENNTPAYLCYKSVGFQDIVSDEAEYYQIDGEEWKCMEMKTVL